LVFFQNFPPPGGGGGGGGYCPFPPPQKKKKNSVSAPVIIPLISKNYLTFEEKKFSL